MNRLTLLWLGFPLVLAVAAWRAWDTYQETIREAIRAAAAPAPAEKCPMCECNLGACRGHHGDEAIFHDVLLDSGEFCPACRAHGAVVTSR